MRPVVIPHPSLGDKLRRAVWNAAWLLLYRPSPIPLHGWRRLLLLVVAGVVAGLSVPPLFIVPALFTVVDDFQQWFGGLFAPTEKAAVGSAPSDAAAAG